MCQLLHKSKNSLLKWRIQVCFSKRIIFTSSSDQSSPWTPICTFLSNSQFIDNSTKHSSQIWIFRLRGWVAGWAHKMKRSKKRTDSCLFEWWNHQMVKILPEETLPRYSSPSGTGKHSDGWRLAARRNNTCRCSLALQMSKPWPLTNVQRLRRYTHTHASYAPMGYMRFKATLLLKDKARLSIWLHV